MSKSAARRAAREPQHAVSAVPAWPRHVVRATGLLLALLATLPLYRGLADSATGRAGAATVREVSAYTELAWTGALIVLGVSFAAGLILSETLVQRALVRGSALLLRPARTVYAGALALLASILSAWFSRAVLDGQPDIIDSFAQLTHARFLAAGQLAGPVSPFWHIQQTLATPAGWVSQYPPGYLLLLAAGLKAGAVWLVGPLLAGVTVFFSALAAEELLNKQPALARLGALLLALSPFLIAQSGSFMSHTAAAAAGAVALYTLARARNGAPRLLLATGAACGALFSIRPYTAVVLGLVIAIALFFEPTLRTQRRASYIRLAAGVLPFAVLVAAYNQWLFGSPFRFGYTAALGPAGGLGLHTDPWGNHYGAEQALQYTSADLTALNVFLLESPFPLVAFMGLALALQPQLDAPRLLIAGWALAPVVANMFYWHHGLYRGPRMLADVAPAWVLLAVLAFAALATLTRGVQLSRWSAYPAVLTAALLVLLVAPLAFGPGRLLSYRRPPLNAMLLQAPAVAQSPALVFVHGGWAGRIAARLAAAGMRLDSVEVALQQNSTCAVHAYADAYEQKRVLPQLDLEPRSYGFPQQVQVTPGNNIRVRPGEKLTPECVREVNADRSGVTDVSPLIWQGALPDDQTDPRPLFVRDLGPERNQEMLRRFPQRSAFLYGPALPDNEPRLWPYEGAVRSLWGSNGRIE